MSRITVACPGCDQRYTLDSSHAGRKVRCKKCQGVFVAEAPASAEAPALDVYGLDEDEANSWKAPSASRSSYDEEDDLPPVHRQSRPKARPKSARRRSGGAGEPALPDGIKTALLIALGGGLLAAALAFVAPTPALIVALCAAMIPVVLLIAGNLWMIVESFRIGVLNGVLALVVPFYMLYVLIKHWDVMRRPFVTSICSYGLAVALSLLISVIGGQRQGAAGPQGGALAVNPGAGDFGPPDFGLPPGAGGAPIMPAAAAPGAPAGPDLGGPAGPAGMPGMPSPPSFGGPSGVPMPPSFGGPAGPGGPDFGGPGLPGGPPFGPADAPAGPGFAGPGGPGSPPFGGPAGAAAPFGGGDAPRPPTPSGPSIGEYRSAVIRIISAATQAHSALSALAIRPDSPPSWERLRASIDQLNAEADAFRALPPLPEPDRVALGDDFRTHLGAIRDFLSDSTGRALQRAGRFPQAALLPEPRRILAEVTDSLGISSSPAPVR